MKKIILLLFPFLLLPACTPGAPSEAVIQTAIAATEAARPTAAAMPIATAELTGTAAPTMTPEQPPAGSTPVDALEPLSDRDAGQIYAAAIRQMYGVDHFFGGNPPQFPLVYVVTRTSDGSTLDIPATPPQKLSPELRQSIEAELADRPFEMIWIESLDEAPVERSSGKIAGGQGIVITPGNILPQDDGTVHLPFFMVCGGLCLSGKTYVLGEVDGLWQVTGSVGVEVEA